MSEMSEEIKKEEIKGKERSESIKEETYSRDELISLSKDVFNVNPEVIEGALLGVSKNEVSISEVRNYIQKFLERKVK